MYKSKKEIKKEEVVSKPVIEKVEVQEVKEDNGVRVITRING